MVKGLNGYSVKVLLRIVIIFSMPGILTLNYISSPYRGLGGQMLWLEAGSRKFEGKINRQGTKSAVNSNSFQLKANNLEN